MGLGVLHINDSTGWRGGENQTYLLVKGLISSGVHCELVTQAKGALWGRCKELGCILHPLELHGIQAISSIARIRRLAKKPEISCVHAHTARAHTIAFAALACLNTSIPLVVTRRNLPRLKTNRGTLFKYKKTDHIIAISTAISQRLTDMAVTQSKISIIPSGIDMNKFNGVRYLGKEELGIPPQRHVIGVVAALTVEKGHRTVLSALKRLIEGGKDVHGLFVGDGPLRYELQEHAKELGIADSVTFTGHRDDIGSILPLLDIYVLASRSEGLGTATLDALLAGVPVVAANVGGIPDIITHLENGLLFDSGDSDMLSRHIQKLFDCTALSKELVSNGYKRLEKFDIQKTVSMTADVYSRICS